MTTRDVILKELKQAELSLDVYDRGEDKYPAFREKLSEMVEELSQELEDCDRAEEEGIDFVRDSDHYR